MWTYSIHPSYCVAQQQPHVLYSYASQHFTRSSPSVNLLAVSSMHMESGVWMFSNMHCSHVKTIAFHWFCIVNTSPHRLPLMGTDGDAGMESPFRGDPEIRFVGGACAYIVVGRASCGTSSVRRLLNIWGLLM